VVAIRDRPALRDRWPIRGRRGTRNVAGADGGGRVLGAAARRGEEKKDGDGPGLEVHGRVLPPDRPRSNLEKKWERSIRDWSNVLGQFADFFKDRLSNL
jgi:hypothetical protein